jgi:hypothetical protein
MNQKNKRAPVNQNPIADRVIPNPRSVYGFPLTKMQVFCHESMFSW